MPDYVHKIIYYSAPTIVRFAVFACKWAQFCLMEFHNIQSVLKHYSKDVNKQKNLIKEIVYLKNNALECKLNVMFLDT